MTRPDQGSDENGVSLSFSGVLGLDPGYRNTGAALLDATGDVRWCDTLSFKSKREPLAQTVCNLRALTEWLVRTLDTYRPELVAVELPTNGAQSASGAFGQGRAQGLVVALLTMREQPWVLVSPGDVKAASGKKNASKEEVIDAALRRWHNSAWPDTKNAKEHAADAAFAALWAMGQQRKQERKQGRLL